MTVIEPGRIPMSETESAAVDELLAGRSGTITRRDPNESGPLLVEVDGDTHLIDGEEASANG